MRKSQNYKPGFDADYLQRTPSQEGISPLEQEESPYLASILDFRPEHIDFLKEMKKATLYHIEKIYQVNPEKDKVECYFHFPYGEATTTPHLHICVNRKRHPLEMTRSIADDKLISLLENKINIADFIAGNNPYFMENTATTYNLFNQMKGVNVEVIANPLLLASPLTNSAEIFKSLDILQNSSQLIYLKTGKLIMKLKFEDLDQKIAEHTLTMRDIIEKTLAINIALKNYFPNTPDFRNPVIQGHAAWIIMYEYLSENKEKLSTEIQDFLQGNSSGNVNIFSQLTKTSNALEQDFKALIREDINMLNEAEIKTRSSTGRIYHYYNETEKNRILSLLKQKSLINADNQFNATFYLLYRPRDGRFFCVPDTEINLCADLNLSPTQYADLSSTHININEGLNCKDIFEKHFASQSTKDLPVTVNSKDSLLYCGIEFKNVEINTEAMYSIEIFKNPPICEANIICIKGPVNDFKIKYNFPELQVVVPLHINIGVILRKEAQEILSAKPKSVLDLIGDSVFASPLKKAMEMQQPFLGDSGLTMFKPQILTVANPDDLQKTFVVSQEIHSGLSKLS